MTKGTPHQLLRRRTRRGRRSTDAPEDLVYVDEFEVRGREARIKLWSLVSSPPRVPAQTAPGSETSDPPPP